MKKPTTVEKWQASRARREAALATKAELELQEKQGRLISKELVESQSFTIYRTVRDQLQNIPAQLCHSLAGQTDAEIIRESLEDKIRAILEQLARSVPNQLAKPERRPRSAIRTPASRSQNLGGD